jgi:aminoglycoside phosphotransferase (APT) family kinase protein
MSTKPSVDLLAALDRWARLAVPGASGAAGVHSMPGNAGLSFGFDAVDSGGNRLASYVIRLAPPGVRRSGNTDVLRLVPLLRVLQTVGIPIAEVVWASPDESWFGTDAIVQRKIAAKPLHMTDSDGSVEPCDGDPTPYLRNAIEVLAHLHRVPWQRLLDNWEKPKSLAEDLAFWNALLDKSPEAGWAAAGRALADRLARSIPRDPLVGLYHGDYQTNNVLFWPGGAVAAVVDWEIAGIGALSADVGWLSMMTDLSCWHPTRHARMRVLAEPQQLYDWYCHFAGRPIAHFDWFRSFACFKFGTIATFNVRLHRSGRRVDPAYDELAPSIDVLFARGAELTASRE